MEKKRKLIMIIGSFLSIAVIIITLTVLLLKLNHKDIVQVINVKYDATDLINSAMNKLKDDKNQAEVISDVKTMEKVIALDFKGFSDTETNQQILDLLSKYNRKATFFIPGILAAEDSNMVQAIYADGHKVGSNTLSVTKNMEEYSTEELVEDFCRTNNILSTYTNEIPTLLECNSTEYTDNLLKAAYASGNQKVVKSNHYLSYQSFSSYEQVLDYVKNLDKGSIITIKMKGELDETEYEPKEVDEKPAVDKQAGVKDTKASEASLTEEERLVKVVGWILQALEETEYKTVFVEDLYKNDDPDFAKNFDAIRNENAGVLATVYRKVKTGKNLVSFSFRGLENEKNLNNVLEYLDKNDIKATFYVTAEDIVRYPERIETIIKMGQNVANGGMTGKDVTTMSFNEICLEIYKCDKLLKEKFDIHTDLYMPVYGKCNDLVREAAASLGYRVITYSKNPITNKDKSVTEIMQYFKNGVVNGDIIFFRLDYYDDVLKVVEKTYDKIQASNLDMCSLNILLAYENKGFLTAMSSNNDTSTKTNIAKNNLKEDVVKPIGTITDKGNSSNSDKSNSNESKDDSIKGIDNATDQEKNNWPTLTSRQLAMLKLKNNGLKATVSNTIHTTEPALSFTFYGIENAVGLDDVLEKMELLQAKGTFFVTKEDILNYKDRIKKIAKAGHEIGICLNAAKDTDYNSVSNSIYGMQTTLKKLIGQKPHIVRYAYNLEVSNEVLEAISSSGCRLIWQDISLANSKAGKEADLDKVLQYTFNDGNISAQRGDIYYFRMDYYTNPLLTGKLMKDIVKNRVNTVAYNDGNGNNGSVYTIKSLSSLLNSDKTYDYPVKSSSILASVKDAIYPGHLDSFTSEDKFKYLKGHYIGTPSISSVATLPGFTDSELLQLDKTGTFTGDKVIFLTFDDWGSDKPINQLLYVLKKYNVNATFFIRTGFVQNNPNLLRAIAEAGHAVGSHSDAHLTFANPVTSTDEYNIEGTFTALTEDEINVRKTDLQTSYSKLQSIIGDITVNGIPALTKIFRPPTLAMSKGGMEAIFDMGFHYIVSGDFSTHDYEATSVDTLADEIINGIQYKSGAVTTMQNGSVVVLHMSDDSIVPTDSKDITAAALDIAIPKLLEKGYHFAKLSDYLTDDMGAVK